jgi:hypothetical protein
VLSGTPAAGGFYSFTVTATDANGVTGDQAFTLNVVQPTFTFSPSTLSPATDGAPYTQTITASGGTAPYSNYVILLKSVETSRTTEVVKPDVSRGRRIDW